MGEIADTASPQEVSPERLFRTVSGELERTLWQVLLRPTTDDLRVLQLGAVVELMPNVYLQAVRLMYQKPFDRYVRLWCIVPSATGAEGASEERTLLCFYTPGFPDPQFTDTRPGMDLNLTWLDAIRVRLGQLFARVDAQYLAESGDQQRPLVHAPAQTNGATYPPVGDLQHPPRPAVHAGPLAAAPAISGVSKRADLLAQHAEQVFEDLRRTRDTAYAERDRLDAALRDTYFARYPFMRQAIQHASELNVADLVTTWARNGCPEPEGAQVAGADAADPSASATRAAVPATAGAPAAGASAPWALALALERAQAQIGERTRLLEQLCELTGGHFPVPRRDIETTRMRTICARCEAQLSARAPDASEDWMR